VFGVLDILQKTAPWLISSQRAILAGKILGVKNGYAVQLLSDRRQSGQAYIKREFDPQTPNTYNFLFIILTADTPSCLVV
jgi:hypothetical protein